MADLDDRAQVMLVAAFALGVTFVALALIVNSAIFTENLASRGDTTDGEKAVQYRSDLTRGVGEVLDYENRNGATHSDVRTRVATAIRDVDEVLTRNNVLVGATSNASLAGSREGALINQTDFARNFTDANTDEDWTVVQNVDRTRAFQFTINRSALTGEFTVLVANGSDSWEFDIEDDSGDVAVEVAGSSVTCGPVAEPSVVVDVTAGTVGGEDCSALSFGDAPAGGYDISFRDGDDAGGTYSLVVDNSSVATSPPSTFGTQPSVTPALYSVNVSYGFGTANTELESTLRVAPGESDG